MDKSYLVGTHIQDECQVMRVYEAEASDSELAIPVCVATILAEVVEVESDILDIVTVEIEGGEMPAVLVNVTEAEAALKAIEFMDACEEPHANISSTKFARALGEYSPDFAAAYEAAHPEEAFLRHSEENPHLTYGYF